MPKCKPTVVQVIKPPPPLPGPRRPKYYGIAARKVGNVIEIYPFIPKEMK